MKRLGFLLLLWPLFASAEVVVPIESVQNNVNIRMSPDAQSEIVGRLDQGDWLTLVNSVPGWHEVEIAGGATGFISADWSSVLDEPPTVEAEVVAETPAVEEPQSVVEESVTDTPNELADLDEEPVDALVAEIVEDAAGADDTVDSDTEVDEIADQLGKDEASEIPVIETADADEAVAEAVDAPVASESGVETPAVVDAPVVQPEEPAATVAEAPEAEGETEVAPEMKEEAGDEVVPEPVVADISTENPGTDDATVPTDPIRPVAVATPGAQGAQGPAGPMGPPGPMGPAGPAGAAVVEGSVDFLMKFTAPTIGGNSQIFDDGNFIGIGTTEPKQRLEVNGNIQIHERNSSVAGLMITQSDGETGYIMHNRASTLTIGAGSIDRITIDREGNVGFGVARPSNPIELANGAHVTAGGVWTNASSRDLKENIEGLSAEEALQTLAALEPVQFNYRNDREEGHIGFIAEDVPDLVAMQDRNGPERDGHRRGTDQGRPGAAAEDRGA